MTQTNENKNMDWLMFPEAPLAVLHKLTPFAETLGIH